MKERVQIRLEVTAADARWGGRHSTVIKMWTNAKISRVKIKGHALTLPEATTVRAHGDGKHMTVIKM